jgi:hypothetical protein
VELCIYNFLFVVSKGQKHIPIRVHLPEVLRRQSQDLDTLPSSVYFKSQQPTLNSPPYQHKMADSEDVKDSALHKIRNWGGSYNSCANDTIVAKHVIESSFPPTLLATLVTAQHLKPFQPLPMLFPPVLLLSSYLNINGFKTDAAGISAAWSGLYLLLAMRRKQVSYAQSIAKNGGGVKQYPNVIAGLAEQIWGERCYKRSYVGSLCC